MLANISNKTVRGRYRMAMQIGMGFGKFLARVLFQELGISVPSSVFHVLFITRSLHAHAARSSRSCAREVREQLWSAETPSLRKAPRAEVMASVIQPIIWPLQSARVSPGSTSLQCCMSCVLCVLTCYDTNGKGQRYHFHPKTN